MSYVLHYTTLTYREPPEHSKDNSFELILKNIINFLNKFNVFLTFNRHLNLNILQSIGSLNADGEASFNFVDGRDF